VVHPKPPFGGPEVALKYLARYTHRVAISDRRLLSSDDGTVRFSYKDYAQGGEQREMTLDALEFLRRFLLHALPKGFVRIRYYGFLANRHRREQLARARELLAVPVAEPANEPTGTDSRQQHRCPLCRQGRMLLVETYWCCVEHLHSCVFALLYSALAHHQLSCDCPKTSSPSTLDDLPEHGYGRSKTFKSLPLSSTAARFNALYQKRPPCSFRASSREALPAVASDTTLSIVNSNLGGTTTAPS